VRSAWLIGGASTVSQAVAARVHRSEDPMASSEAFSISCDSCVRQYTDQCGDCVVSYICGREPDDAVIINVDEFRAMRLLHEAGLIPALRHAKG
jgi:hypothetical protein